jgi:hypothetical protein
MKKLKRKNLLHIVTKLHHLFTASGFVSKDNSDLRLTIMTTKALIRWVSCEGHHGLKRAKVMSNVLNRHLMGTPLINYPLSSTYRRLILKILQKCVNTNASIYWISVLTVYRLYRLAPVYDTDTITSEFKGRLTGLLDWNILKSLKPTKQSFSQAIDKNWSATWKWHISGASGPNGSVSYTRYLDDLYALSNSRVGIYVAILYFTLPYVNKREAVNALVDALTASADRGDKQALHSRLTFLGDKGGKTRVIALVDILTQSCLSTVHQRCNAILRRLKQDGTFDQDKARSYIKRLTGHNVFLASIDLTAATDRLPALYQVFVLIYLRILTPLQALGWYLVTTRREFVYLRDGSPKYVRYAVGQPMGELSSWPVMAISHHFLVRLSYAMASVHHSNWRYALLGDDLTLASKPASNNYLRLISYLGVDYSVDKTYLTIGAAEFAKSLFREGKDLTPFSTANLVFRKNTIVSNVQAIMVECKRINLPLSAQTLLELFPKRWRQLVLLAALSPSSPSSVLDLHSRKDYWVFTSFVLQQRIRYFSNPETVFVSTHIFVVKAPITSGGALSSPFLQIGQDNSNRYPVRHLEDLKALRNPEVLIGHKWIAYDSVCWPDGLPSIGDRKLIPGPTWEKDIDDSIVRSSLEELNKLMPGYFYIRCGRTQVGD